METHIGTQRPHLLDSLDKLGYAVFTNGAFNLNLIGVRSNNQVANAFDDQMHVIYKNLAHQWVHQTYAITTDPGAYWLLNPMQPDGTAILVPGQYRGAYMIGTHYDHEALVQWGAPVDIWRDNNRDVIINWDKPMEEEEGWFGINIHRASPYGETIDVGQWSAGCQVFANALEFDHFMKLCKKSRSTWGDKFTYTLLTQDQAR
jgi:hypothetical protein